MEWLMSVGLSMDEENATRNKKKKEELIILNVFTAYVIECTHYFKRGKATYLRS
jgi:hypothetical protein